MKIPNLTKEEMEHELEWVQHKLEQLEKDYRHFGDLKKMYQQAIKWGKYTNE